MRKKASWWQNALLAAFIAALAFGAYQAEQVGNHLQYLILAPEQAQETAQDGDTGGVADDEFAQEPEPFKPNQPIIDKIDSLKNSVTEWETTMEAWTVGGVIEKGEVGGQSARVELVGESGLAVRSPLLREGRLFYADELLNGAKVAVLDEQLALSLFRIPYPLGEEISIGAETYRIIGVVRHTKKVGDLVDYVAYIPLMSVIDTSTTVDALQIEAIPKPGVGASTSFKSQAENAWPGGTFYDLGKESMGARLWLRVLLFVAGMTAALRLIAWLNGRVRQYMKRYRQQLQRHYAPRLMPELIGVILLFALGYGAAAGLVALLMSYIIEPVYTFPEWIPAILVEWSDIADAFWKVWQLPAVMVELRTPEILRLRWLDLLIKGCSAGTAVLLALRYARSRTLADELNDSLTGLYREGVLVSVIRTTRPIAMGEMGYVPCRETDAWQPGPMHPRRHRRRGQSTPMMRIINAERVLAQLPAGKRDGSFVIEVTDDRIEQNNGRWCITCQDGAKTMTEVNRDWDIQLPVETLARVVYGNQKFSDFLETNAGFDMKMHSPAMDGIFDQKLPITPGAV